jgi:hypothetical protein
MGEVVLAVVVTACFVVLELLLVLVGFCVET